MCNVCYCFSDEEVILAVKKIIAMDGDDMFANNDGGVPVVNVMERSDGGEGWLEVTGNCSMHGDGRIKLTVSRILILLEYLRKITRDIVCVDEGRANVCTRYHLGGNIYVCVNLFAGVQKDVFLGEFGLEDDEQEEATVPINGIDFTRGEWECFGEYLISEEIKKDVRKFSDGEKCYDGGDHLNQLGLLTCSECCPNTFHLY